MIHGRCGDPDEPSGSIALLAADPNTELGRIAREQVGIVAPSVDFAASEGAGFRVMQAAIHVEDMKLFFDTAHQCSWHARRPPGDLEVADGAGAAAGWDDLRPSSTEDPLSIGSRIAP